MKLKTLILTLLLSAQAYGYQHIPVQEGTPVSAHVSATALNRIAVENDRIVSIKGTTGEFELDKDPELGQIFIKPAVEKEEPIDVFITTEKGHTYALSLIAADTGAENIVLAPIGNGITALAEKSDSYEMLLKNIVKAMHTQTVLEGFITENAKIKLPKVHGAEVQHLQSYAGNSLLGEILEVSNRSSEALILTESDFYGEGVRAVAIVNKVISAKGKTRVYRVRSE